MSEGPRALDYAIRSAPWSDIQDHLPFLYETVSGYDNPVVIELGVRSGVSTSAFLAALETHGGELWSCDIDRPDVPEEWYTDPHWTFLQGDDLNMQAVLPAQCDVLFIDTSHTFEQTLAELRAYVPRVRPGGVVLMHDTQWEFPNISLPEEGGFVTDALNLFCKETGLEWHNRRSAHHDPSAGRMGGYGLAVIHIGAE